MMKEGWCYKKLNEICISINAGGTPSRTKKAYWNGDIPWIKIRDIQGKYVSKSEEYITNAGVANSSAKVFDEGTILYTIFATVGEVAILNFKAATNQAIAGLRLKDGYDLDFIYYSLLSIKKNVINLSKGVAQNNINLSILRNLEIPIPTYCDQKTIVLELDNLNEILAKKREQLKELDRLGLAIFYDMFGDPILNEKNWEMVPFSYVGTFGRGVSKHRPRNAEKLLGGTVPLIQTGDVARANMYITEYVSTYSEFGVAQSKIWKSGTLCITIAATIGKCAILTFDACFPDSVVGFVQYWLHL